MPILSAPAGGARIMVAVTFHFRAERLKHLFNTVKALAGFPVRVLDVSVFTNTARTEEVAAIDSLCAPPLLSSTAPGLGERRFRIVSCPGLNDPRHLPWCHKPLIRDGFLADPQGYDYFIYLEDDIELPFNSFRYFTRYLGPLAPLRLIPSFLRVEYDYAGNRLTSTDQWEVSVLAGRPSVELDGFLFSTIENPYTAMFILDRALAREYVASRSFDLETSRQVHTWEVMERAAMGLCFESPQPPFYARFVVPVDPTTMRPPSFCWVYHTANNYSNDPGHTLGKMSLDALFRAMPPDADG